MAGVAEAFKRYDKYIQRNKGKFPESVFKLVSSKWYFDPSEHKCPHDAWLETFTMEEPAEGERHEVRKVSIRIVLLTAYHDGYIGFSYDGVASYSLTRRLIHLFAINMT